MSSSSSNQSPPSGPVATSMSTTGSNERLTWPRPLTELFAGTQIHTLPFREGPAQSASCRQQAQAAETTSSAFPSGDSPAESEKSAITMQDLIDSLVEESLKQPQQQSNYIRASETMFENMMTGKRSWNINSCPVDPNFDYQSRLDNLTVLNNLLISMEASGAASSGSVGDNIISQMMVNSESFGMQQRKNPFPQYRQQSNAASSRKQHHLQNSSEQTSSSSRKNRRMQHQAPVDQKGDSDSSTSSAEKSPESASDSASSLCGNCQSLKIADGRCSCSGSSPSSSSQSSTDSRNASPSNKDDHNMTGSSATRRLPPPPPLIEFPVAQDDGCSIASFGSSEMEAPKEAKHPKKRMKDRHFRETSSGTGSDSGGSSGSENGNNVHRMQDPTVVHPGFGVAGVSHAAVSSQFGIQNAPVPVALSEVERPMSLDAASSQPILSMIQPRFPPYAPMLVDPPHSGVPTPQQIVAATCYSANINWQESLYVAATLGQNLISQPPPITSGQQMPPRTSGFNQ